MVYLFSKRFCVHITGRFYDSHILLFPVWGGNVCWFGEFVLFYFMWHLGYVILCRASQRKSSNSLHHREIRRDFRIEKYWYFLFCASNTESNLTNEFIFFSIVNIIGSLKNGISSRKKNSIGKNSLWWYRQCNWNPNEIFTHNYVKDFGSSHCIAVHNVVVRAIFLVWIFQQLVSIDLSVGVSFVLPRMKNGSSHLTSCSGLRKFA